MEIEKLDIKLAAAFAGVLVGNLFGRMDGPMVALLVFIVVDYLSGIASAAGSGKLSSAVGFKGILKKIGILACVIVGNVLDMYVLDTEASPCRTMVIFFYLANEGLSILENLGNIGVPIPDKLRRIIEELKDKEG